MELYTIIGLEMTERVGYSYETDSSLRGTILRNGEGMPMTKQHTFYDYVIYATLENEQYYYAIYLWETHGVSLSGRLCKNAHMKIDALNSIDRITHYPIRPLRVYADFEIREYGFDEQVDVDLCNDPYTRVFSYNGLGYGDECVPDGYVVVNMDLFWEKNLLSRM